MFCFSFIHSCFSRMLQGDRNALNRGSLQNGGSFIICFSHQDTRTPIIGEGTLMYSCSRWHVSGHCKYHLPIPLFGKHGFLWGESCNTLFRAKLIMRFRVQRIVQHERFIQTVCQAHGNTCT